jgi:GT2 family glycosyltransferase
MAGPSICVLVPTWNRPADLERCLGALGALEDPVEQVVVVAREDDAAGRAVLTAHAGELPLDEVVVDRPGAVHARNEGLRKVRTDIVAFIDDDVAPHPDWARRIRTWFAGDERLGALGGRDHVRLFNQGGRLDTGRRDVVGKVSLYGRIVGLHHLGHGEPREVDVLKGANLIARVAALPPGGFDANLRGAGAEHHEDWTLTLAIKAAGWRVVFDPAVAVDHFQGPRFGGTQRGLTSGRERVDKLHNRTYAAVRHLPAWQAVAHVVHVLLIGTQHGPGVLGAPALALKQRDASPVRELPATLRARAEAVACAVRARRRGPR